MIDTIKIIESQQTFAKNVYLDFLSKRFGITPCCISDPIGTTIKKQLCDWNALDRDIPTITSITSELFIPTSPIEPCSDPAAPDWCTDCGYYLPSNYKELQEQIVRLENLIAELCAMKESQVEKEEALLAEIEALQSKVTIITKELAALEELYVDLDCENNPPSGTDACDVLLQQIKDFKSQLSDIEEILISLNSELSEVQAVIAKIQAEIDAASSELIDIEANFCDDSECITVAVTDQHGDPVENYEIIIDGGNAGFTNSKGIFYYVIPKASKDVKHTLQICYCFSTVGNCRQQKLNIVINTGKEKEDCTVLESCDQVKIINTIQGSSKETCIAIPGRNTK